MSANRALDPEFLSTSPRDQWANRWLRLNDSEFVQPVDSEDEAYETFERLPRSEAEPETLDSALDLLFRPLESVTSLLWHARRLKHPEGTAELFIAVDDLLEAALRSLRTGMLVMGAPNAKDLEPTSAFRTVLECAAQVLWLYGVSGKDAGEVDTARLSRVHALHKKSRNYHQSFLDDHGRASAVKGREDALDLTALPEADKSFKTHLVLERTSLHALIGSVEHLLPPLAAWRFASARSHGEHWADLEKDPSPDRGIHRSYSEMVALTASHLLVCAASRHHDVLREASPGPKSVFPGVDEAGRLFR